MSNVIVLGAGMVGSSMAIDMAKNHHVTVSDLSQDALEKLNRKAGGLKTRELPPTPRPPMQPFIRWH